MFGRDFDRIMKEQSTANLSAHEEMGIMQAKVNTTNLLLREYHATPHPRREKEKQGQEV